MSSIIWQSRSPVIYESFKKGELINASNGGNAYDYQAVNALSGNFKIDVDAFSIKTPTESVLSYWWRMRKHRASANVCIMEPFPMLYGRRSAGVKSVAMIHHIDDTNIKMSLKHRWFFNQLVKRLPQMDLVVTVSEYWAGYLKRLGCNRVKVIYNSFNPSDYIVAEEAKINFKKQHGFNNEQPIVYIGNAARQKGVYETYEVLKNSNYQLVMTGAENRASDLPVKFLNLSRTDFVTLLNLADVVVTMSKLIEGWNRIAHEALLCKTPVIGSGTGGMKELLEGARQTIIHSPSQLPAMVENTLKNKAHQGTQGYGYVSKYDHIYFKNEWISTIQNLLKS